MDASIQTRNEIKVLTEGQFVPQVRSCLRLHPEAFRVAYPPRRVNSVYFDTPHLESYAENLAGVSERKKIRLRWYGEESTGVLGTVEIKCKRAMQGWKVSHRLEQPIDFPGNRWDKVIAQVRAELPLGLRPVFDPVGWPMILNRYYREYYESADGVLRVTLDYDQVVYDQRRSGFPNLTRPLPRYDELVIEFKADTEHANRLAMASSHLPFRISTHSKYALGIEDLLE